MGETGRIKSWTETPFGEEQKKGTTECKFLIFQEPNSVLLNNWVHKSTRNQTQFYSTTEFIKAHKVQEFVHYFKLSQHFLSSQTGCIRWGNPEVQTRSTLRTINPNHQLKFITSTTSHKNNRKINTKKQKFGGNHKRN